MGEVLHIVPQLSGGGAGRAALTAAAAAAEVTEMRQTIVSLRPAMPALAIGARKAQLQLADTPSREVLHEAIGKADLVHVHYWNTPELIELLESNLPPCRLLVWPGVVGHTPPQVIDPTLIRRAARMIATSRRSAETIARFSDETAPEVIPPVPGWDRVAGVARSASGGFNIGYIGTVSMMRLHSDFIEMSAATQLPEARFIVCGDGDALRSLPREAEELGVAGRFEFRGFIERIADGLSEFDVFGYPIRPGTSASSDLNLKEAMYAGVPPVVLADDSITELVEDGTTGLVAATPAEYPRALERLYEDREARARLSANARQHAVERWSFAAVGRMWQGCYERALSAPRRAGPALDPPAPGSSPGVARFMRDLGEHAGDFETSLRGSAEERIEADLRIQSSPLEVAYQDGGLLDFRRRHPDDPMLALWTGLALRGAGRRALATAELHRAQQLGIDRRRIAKHLDEVLAA
jgi:glycosyltransferase involved in cell wall biosynthesis